MSRIDPFKICQSLLFTGESGSTYGYKDDFRVDGTFWYRGEGQVRDMTMDRGNAAIRDHRNEGKRLVLFEYVSNGRVRCLGEATYLGHHIEERPDRNGDIRNALVFELDVNSNNAAKDAIPPETDNPNERTLRLWSRPLSEVRSLALNKAPSAATEKTRRIVARQRSEAVRIYVLRRAHGTCEACNRGAPFQASAGRPYLEPHHIHRLADGGPDAPNAVAAVCPNFHREVHHGVNGKSLNDKLAQVVETLEADS
jgi:5-methylcytosine-specific restriction protein A